MVNIPGYKLKEYLTEQQYRIFIALHFMVILLFTILLSLTSVNIWQILVKQGRWKTTALLFFYIFTMIAVVFREIELIWADRELYVWMLMAHSQPFAKISAGLIQAWIILELAIRMR